MSISAVILSSTPVTKRILGVEITPLVSTFRDVGGLLAARFAAIRKVRTEWFFCLDDDDELPSNYADVLERGMLAGTPLVYTNELVRYPDGRERLLRPGPYRRSAYAERCVLVHHLAICNTQAALRAMARVPSAGWYGFETLLYPEIARDGATWLDEVGYVWNCSGSGLSTHPSMAYGLMRSAVWTNRRT